MHRTLLQEDFTPVIGQRGSNHEQYIPTNFHIPVTPQAFVNLCVTF
jgi:hypothetical protein